MPQPAKTLSLSTIFWTIVLIFQIFSLLPVGLYYAGRRNRPHHGYSLHQALARKLMFDLMLFYTRVQWVMPLVLSSGNIVARFVLIKPSPRLKVYQGPLLNPKI